MYIKGCCCRDFDHYELRYIEKFEGDVSNVVFFRLFKEFMIYFPTAFREAKSSVRKISLVNVIIFCVHVCFS